jgi:hypothetical protein
LRLTLSLAITLPSSHEPPIIAENRVEEECHGGRAGN